MNKKAFTLIEVLAVLVIVSILLAVVIPSTSYAIKEGKLKKYEAAYQNVIDYLTLYNLDKEDLLWKSSYCSGNVCNVPYQKLLDNYSNFKVLDECVISGLTIKKDKNNFDYKACMVCKEKNLVIFKKDDCK